MTRTFQNPNVRTDKWEIVKTVQKLRTQLGLNSRDCVVLSALMSFLRKNQATSGGIVFPSNKTLADRAAGMSERSLRRAIAALCKAGLISRNDSPNRKRYPLRAKSKGDDDAFGLDLRPAFSRHSEMLNLQYQATNEDAEKQSIRAIILSERHKLLSDPAMLSQKTRNFLENLKTVLRRKLSIQALQDLYQKVLENLPQRQDSLQSTTTATTCKMTGNNGQSDRHQKTTKKENKLDNPDKHAPSLKDIWASCTTICTFFPDPPISKNELTGLLIDIARFMAIPKKMVLQALELIGPGQTMKALDKIASDIANITCPSRYFSKMASNIGIEATYEQKAF